MKGKNQRKFAILVLVKYQLWHVNTPQKKNPKLCHADKLTEDDLRLNFDKFYENTKKVEQDREFLQFMKITNVKQHRKKVDTVGRRIYTHIHTMYPNAPTVTR